MSLGFLLMLHPRKVEQRPLIVSKTLGISSEVWATRECEVDREEDGR